LTHLNGDYRGNLATARSFVRALFEWDSLH
jgi:hypothetical protein